MQVMGVFRVTILLGLDVEFCHVTLYDTWWNCHETHEKYTHKICQHKHLICVAKCEKKIKLTADIAQQFSVATIHTLKYKFLWQENVIAESFCAK